MSLQTLRRALVAVALVSSSFGLASPAFSLDHPTVNQTVPTNGQTHVDPATNIVAGVTLVNGGAGIDASTLRPGSDVLVQPVDPVTKALGAPIAAQANVDGAGATITITPLQCLQLSTKYKVTLLGGRSGIHDTAGGSLSKKVWSFTTTTSGGSCVQPTSVSYARSVVVPTGTGHYTSLTVGPVSGGISSPTGRMLYAATLDGRIDRWPILSNGQLGTRSSIAPAALAGKEIVGLAFQPQPAFRLWVTANAAFDGVNPAPDWGGEIWALDGSALTTAHRVIYGLPRSAKDHETNSLAFSGNTLYVTQGSNSSAGAPDPAWNNRPEHLLNAALLRVDLSSSQIYPNTTTAKNVQTEGLGSANYDPFAAGAPVTIFASGLRNSFDLVLRGGSIYLPTNGAGPGGNAPAIPAAPGPATCQRRIDGQPYGGPFNLFQPNGLQNLPDQRDFLFRVDPGASSGNFRPFGYYGHPNPTRCEWILGSGNVSGGAFRDARVKSYPAGTAPDPNYRGYVFTFGYNFSPDGIVSYQLAGSPLDGDLMVARYSGGDDILVLPVQADGSVNPLSVRTLANSGGKFQNPLDLAEDGATGDIYVSELDYPYSVIELLTPP